MNKKFRMYSIGISVGIILGVAMFTISDVFGASDLSGHDNPITQELILNRACIEYTLPSGLTGVKCDDVTVYYNSGGGVQEHSYFIQKWQKTGNMMNYTTGEVVVQSGEYIQYKVDFGSITGNCKNGTIKDTLPSCVRYVSSEIYGVSGSPSFSTGSGYIQYSNFRLNGGTQGYILVTGQVMADTSQCENVTRYTNKGGFKCGNPSSDWMYSNVIARREGGGGGGSGSEVHFTKTGNKYEMYPGETGLIFTLKVENKGPNIINNIVIDDIWPNTGEKNCIIYDRWFGSNWEQSGQDYTWNYVGNNGRLISGQYATLYVYAKIRNASSCIGSYINTGKLTYQEGGNTHVLYDDYPFIVVDGSAGYDVSIEKTVEPQEVTQGMDIVYTIKYTNEGTKTLTNYTITDEWPNDKLEFVSSNPSPTINNGETITWSFNSQLLPGKSGVIQINATVR